jgi:diketogulonate reductase-like aldo/keto reductase
VIHEYLAAGGNFLDTADMYGVGHNETLVGNAIKDRRTKVFLATKFGNVRGPKGEFLRVCGTPEYVKQACDASLRGCARFYREVVRLRFGGIFGPTKRPRGCFGKGPPWP